MTVDNLSDLLNEDEVRKIIISSFNTENFSLIGFNVSRLSDNLVGFLGEHFRLKVTLIIKDNKVERSFFIKTAPKEKGSVQFDCTVESGAFQREIDVYNLVIKPLIDDENENSKESWCPKFHYNRGLELLVLDDISSMGYKVPPERQPLDKDHIMVGLRSLAKMHSSTFFMERKILKMKNLHTKDTFDQLYPQLTKEIIFTEENPEHAFTVWFKKIVDVYEILVEYIDEYTEEQKRKIRGKIVPLMKQVVTLIRPSSKYTNVLLHGDLWSNNTLFRYENDKPVSANLIDFQLTRYGPPAEDIMEFLYLSCTGEMRQANEEEFKLYYYQQFENNLKEYGFKENECTTLETFLESCESYRKLANIKSIYMHSFVLTPPSLTDSALSSPEKYKDFFRDNREYYVRESMKDDVYRTRLCEKFKELVDNYILEVKNERT